MVGDILVKIVFLEYIVITSVYVAQGEWIKALY